MEYTTATHHGAADERPIILSRAAFVFGSLVSVAILSVCCGWEPPDSLEMALLTAAAGALGPLLVPAIQFEVPVLLLGLTAAAFWTGVVPWAIRRHRVRIYVLLFLWFSSSVLLSILIPYPPPWSTG